MKAPITTIIWAAVAACGCLDLELLDDMDLLDAGETSSAADTDADADTDGDADGDGPPATDPDDVSPPGLVGLSCGVGETADGDLCVAVGPVSASIRFATDEPAIVVVDAAGASGSGVLSADWSQEHHLAVTGLEPGTPVDVAISFADVNDNGDSTAAQVTASGGDAVAITEVLADPLGAEPAQEFVEVVNLGNSEADLSGWMIDDNGDSDGDPIPEGAILGAGQVGLLVAPDYDPGSAEDPPPAPAALVIHLDSSIASSGLKNSEAETVELYDEIGGLVSCYQGQAGDPKEGRSAVRLTAELPDGDALAWELEPGGGSTPGVAPILD
jgi:hypothetical protein